MQYFAQVMNSKGADATLMVHRWDLHGSYVTTGGLIAKASAKNMEKQCHK